ncbi:Pixie [Aphelenchoides besseyi]|nr:Pixie [Aphelenchoides besseyi]
MKVLEHKFKTIIKVQYVDSLPKLFKGKEMTVNQRGKSKHVTGCISGFLELRHLLDRQPDQLSGGKLQRFAIALCIVSKANVYLFDEPSYLDVRQRLEAAKAIRECSTSSKGVGRFRDLLIMMFSYVMVVEHDLAILDYLSDFVCILYGVSGAYGVVTQPSGVRERINHFLKYSFRWKTCDSGSFNCLSSEVLCKEFQRISLSFKGIDQLERKTNERNNMYSYPNMRKTLGDFQLEISEGSFTDSEIVVMLGENGTGKSTMIQMLAGKLASDDASVEVPKLNISYKPQKISPKYPETVCELLLDGIYEMFSHPTLKTDVLNPLQIDRLLDLQVQNLSSGKLQRVALIICLGKPADVYLIDKPSADLNSEQRLHDAKVMKRNILHSKKTPFIVEHDFMMSTYLAGRVIVFQLNKFMKIIEQTYKLLKKSIRIPLI